MIDSIYYWLANHTAICTWLLAIFAVLTFIFTFIFKKKKEHRQNISDVHDSTINQAGGNISINSKDAE